MSGVATPGVAEVKRRCEIEYFIVAIAFLSLKNTIATIKIFWLPRGNQSITQETIPQENHIFKPAHPHVSLPAGVFA